MSDPRHPVDPDGVDAVLQAGLPAGEAQAMAPVVNLLADPLRFRILSALLVTDELCVGDLAIALDANDDAVSYGLRLLRRAGLVQRRREGRMGYYRLGDGAARQELVAALAHLRALAALGPHSDADRTDDL
ncbi:MAG TPA: metalloregulator ArsR/SmtB family transcription factor [Acidimicrobiales bacterium]|nr:metalloregulator ArsR/SmtB family transcription factor [Acidimicrobiales bacterium]